MTPTLQPSDRRRTVRPVLLILVFAAFLVIVGVTATGQAAVVTADSSTTLLNATVSADAAAVRSFVGLNLSQADLQPGGLSAERQSALQHGLHLLTDRGGILHAALLTPDGTVLASDDGSSVGLHAPQTQGLANAIQNVHADAAIVSSDEAGSVSPLATNSVLREYLPIIDAGRIYATVALWRDAGPILSQLAEGRNPCRDDHTYRRSDQCPAALLHIPQGPAAADQADDRAARRGGARSPDRRPEPRRARRNTGGADRGGSRQRGAIGVALLDLDSFGLLDSTYGHQAGDHVIREVVHLLAAWMPHGATWGRYGPDEFLVITANGREAELEPAVAALRETLSDTALQFEGSERLPVSLSAGICFYPTNGDSVTTLLSMTAMTLQEAKASGGDAIRVAQAHPPEPGYVRTFNILEGLVNAVDTKDRYTRRHSEDVARYAEFLARRLDLEAITRRAVVNAGKLHDIGKIGIPDAILRKPGRLTVEEFEILKQHVALGDAIVRDLPDVPDLELIREGIRYHHERWDGRGYLVGMAKEEIPLVARILAVADAFSAITTTRPYRKSHSTEEALSRIEDAAGTQLDPRLVLAFAEGLRDAADAPLPAGPSPLGSGPALTIPGRQVA